jgi:Asp-tRNA(Asn)/Glu-tRNA(Gln) amidotransferase A subunit family amidase
MIRSWLLLVLLALGLGACVETTIARAKLTPKGDPARPTIDLENPQATKEALQANVYGFLPDQSAMKVLEKRVVSEAAYDGKGRVEEWTIEVEAGFGADMGLKETNRGQFHLVLAIPTAATGPAPVILLQTFCPSNATIAVKGVSGPAMEEDRGFVGKVATYVFGRYICTPPIAEIMDHGFAVATMYPGEVFPDSSEQGPIALQRMSSGYEDDETRWGAIAAWGWLFSRAVDALEQDARFDQGRMVTFGHSRYGKSALVAAAFDNRIDGVIAHQSGTGGASLSRGNLGETVAKITKSFPYWFDARYASFGERTEELPIDQHQLLALLAPRPIMLGNARRDVWSDPNGSFRAAQGASTAWEAFGQTGLQQDRLVPFKPEANLAFWIRPGTHGVVEEDWPAFLQFLDAHFGKTAPQAFSLREASIGDVQTVLRSRQITCQQLIEQALGRIAKYDDSTIHAITEINTNALQTAKALDAEQAKSGITRPLHCVPVLVKDNFDTHDLPTTGGSLALKGSIPPDDAFMVRKLREAGAVVVAKTNMAEWAFSPRETVSSSYGTTANAYDLGRVPAGSSGGTASGVAASYAVAGLGSDTGNSIRGPSSHLALVGIRSTFGLTSRDGVIPLIGDRDVAGPMGKSVEDVAKLFNILAGYDPNDWATEAGKGKREADYTTFLQVDGLRGKRIGVLREWVDHEDADPEITALFFKALDDMKAAGAIIVDPVSVPNMKAHLAADMFCPSFRYDMAQYLKTLGAKAPITDISQVLESGLYGPDAKGSLESLVKFPADRKPEDWDQPCQTIFNNTDRMSYRADVIRAMDEAHLDALVYPTWSNPPARIDKGREEYKGDNSQNLAPNTGLPALTLPMGFSHEKWPAGISLIARPFDEKTLFTLGYSFEQATHHRQPPPGFE